MVKTDDDSDMAKSNNTERRWWHGHNDSGFVDMTSNCILHHANRKCIQEDPDITHFCYNDHYS